MAREERGTSYGPTRRAVQRACGILVLLASSLTVSDAGRAPARAASDRPLRIVAFGDSLTAGYGLPQQAAFPAVLQAALAAKGERVEVANAGVSGDTASGGAARLDWSVPDGTDGVIVELGANDMLRGVDPAVTRTALESIVSRLRARGILVMLAGMRAAPNLGPAYVQSFESIFPDLAGRYDLVLYPFFLDGVAGESASLALPDKLHPSAAGVKVIVERVTPTVELFLARLRGAKGG